jgi:hypothetical protein
MNTDYIEILSPEEEGLIKADRFYIIAITHLSLCLEDAHILKRDIVL